MSFLSDNIRAKRESKQITQIEMADLLDMSRLTYMHIESGERVPSVGEISKIAVILGVAFEDIYDLGLAQDEARAVVRKRLKALGFEENEEVRETTESATQPTGPIKLFEGKKIRSAWNDEQEEWFFSVVDVVEVLTESVNPKQYIKKMRMRDPELNARWGTICTPTGMLARDGKKYQTLASNTEGILRIIQSIPSKKAEPFKQWLARVGRERIEETIDPEIAMQRAADDYRRKGYDADWIRQRLLSIKIRRELTDEWIERGVKEGREFAVLTDEITKAWSDMTTHEYKRFKGLKKENLRDNMTTMELVLSMLGEASTKDISEKEKPQGFVESKDVARRGGAVAGVARKALEQETGEDVITRESKKLQRGK